MINVTINGTLDLICFRGDNNWTVAIILVNGAKVKINGHLTDGKVGDDIVIEGDWVDHQKYGRQFKFTSCKIIQPTTRIGMIGFLASRLDHIGAVRAEKLVDTFGVNNVCDVLLHDHQLLTKIPGITPTIADEVHASYLVSSISRETEIFLRQFGLTDGQVAKIICAYEAEAIEIIKHVPYRMIDDIAGFGFQTVDSIALRTGVSRNSQQRICAGCVFALKEAKNEGNTYLPKENFLESVTAILDVETNQVEEMIPVLLRENRIVIEDNRVYDARLHFLEVSIASQITSMVRQCV